MPSQVISFPVKRSDAINVRVVTQGHHILLFSLFRDGVYRAGRWVR